MRILLVNSNTTEAVTEKIANEAQRWAASGNEVHGVSARFGAEIVSSRAEAAIAQHGLLDACAQHQDKIDAVIVGMSLDSGVWAARQMLDVPVVGMSEAALHFASLHGNRIGLLVFGGDTQPYREMVEHYGYAGKLGAIEALGVTPQEHLRNPALVEDKIVQRTQALAQAGTIESMILVGAVAAGLPQRLQDRMPVPTFEGISCGVLLAEALVRLNALKPKLGSFASPSNRNSVGLSVELAAALASQ